jgi:addiction module RelE/StbE family toxin
MALIVRWTPIALADLNHAFEFISLDKPNAAKATIAKVLDSLEHLKSFPDSGRSGRIKGTREMVVNTTPYLIVYRIKENYLEILTVLHSSRKW